ncbi:MAG: flagellar assembly protein FliW, partial [Anaerotignaceae bacterium]
MKINTKYFSEIEYSDDEVVFFEKGLFGFESEKKFIIIRFNNDNNSLLCLQSINDENLAFVLLNPYNHIKDYSLDMLEKEFEELEIENDNYSTYNICVIKDDLMESTVNLK